MIMGEVLSVWKYVKVDDTWRYKAAIEDNGRVVPNMARVRGQVEFHHSTKRVPITFAAVAEGSNWRLCLPARRKRENGCLGRLLRGSEIGYKRWHNESEDNRGE